MDAAINFRAKEGMKRSITSLISSFDLKNVAAQCIQAPGEFPDGDDQGHSDCFGFGALETNHPGLIGGEYTVARAAV
jgi:hypothetical protein